MLGFSKIEISHKILIAALQEYIDARWTPKLGDARSIVCGVEQKASYDKGTFVVEFVDPTKDND